MSAITKSARGESCTVRVIGYCNSNSETVVLAHLSGIRFKHGIGNKVNDIHGAYCSQVATMLLMAELKRHIAVKV